MGSGQSGRQGQPHVSGEERLGTARHAGRVGNNSRACSQRQQRHKEGSVPVGETRQWRETCAACFKSQTVIPATQRSARVTQSRLPNVQSRQPHAAAEAAGRGREYALRMNGCRRSARRVEDIQRREDSRSDRKRQAGAAGYHARRRAPPAAAARRRNARASPAPSQCSYRRARGRRRRTVFAAMPPPRMASYVACRRVYSPRCTSSRQIVQRQNSHHVRP